jgi:hypothetical protein
MEKVVAVLVPQVPNPGDPIPFRQRHREMIATLMRDLGMS